MPGPSSNGWSSAPVWGRCGSREDSGHWSKAAFTEPWLGRMESGGPEPKWFCSSERVTPNLEKHLCGRSGGSIQSFPMHVFTWFPGFLSPSLKWKIKPPVKAGDMFRPVTHTDSGRLQSGNSSDLITFRRRWWIYALISHLCSDFCSLSWWREYTVVSFSD